MFTVFFGDFSGPVHDYAIAQTQDSAAFARFFHAMLDAGVALPPSGYEAWFLSAAHDDAALNRIVEALPGAAAQSVAQKLSRPIEQELYALSGVREAAVVGEKHPEFGESPVAFLVTDHPLDETALVAHCRAQLAPFKRPRRFVRVERLPRNAMGKVEKRRLADLL